MRHFLQIINKETGKKEEILFYFKDHQVILMDENFSIHYDSNNYLKAKEADDDKKEEKGQTKESQEDGSKSNESVQEV
jgi:hypothetical protein